MAISIGNGAWYTSSSLSMKANASATSFPELSFLSFDFLCSAYTSIW